MYFSDGWSTEEWRLVHASLLEASPAYARLFRSMKNEEGTYIIRFWENYPEHHDQVIAMVASLKLRGEL